MVLDSSNASTVPLDHEPTARRVVREPQNPADLFSFSHGSVTEMLNVFKAIAFREEARIWLNADGFKLIVDDIGLEAVVYIKEGNCIDYAVRSQFSDNGVSFGINMSMLCLCLELSAGEIGASVKMSYGGYGEPLKLQLADSDSVTECRIKTVDAQDPEQLIFDERNEMSRVLLQADGLADAISEIEHHGDTLEVGVTLHPLCLHLSTRGDVGKISCDFPAHTEFVDRIDCRANKPHSNKYRMSIIKRMAKALALSYKVSIRMDKHGLLCMQFMIQLQDGDHCFIEFSAQADVDYGNDEN